MNEFDKNEEERRENEATSEGKQADPPAEEGEKKQQETPSPERVSFTNEPPTFVWDGRNAPSRGNRGKKSGIFCAVAVVCLLLTAAICVPTILYAAGDFSRPGTSGTPSGSSGAPSVLNGQDASYEISQTVTVTDNPYVEESDLTAVYKKCAVSCATIYVTFGGQYTGYSIGSGFVLTEDGYIATNQHVVADGEEITVIFYDGKEYKAELVGEDSVRDLAVLKIDAEGLTPLEIGDSDALTVGQYTIAIGTPYDITLAGTMTTGIVSGLNREIPITNEAGTVIKTMRLIQTDTAINPGNSGGPLINLAGQVVGINSLKLTGNYEGTGFAIPMNYAVEIFNQLIQYGEVVQDSGGFVTASPRLGVTVYNLEVGLKELRIRPRCEYPEEGILVASIEPNTAIYAAGLQMYDIITEFDGKKISNVQDLTAALAERQAGDTVSMTVFSFSRNFASGDTKTLTFVLDSAA